MKKRVKHILPFSFFIFYYQIFLGLLLGYVLSSIYVDRLTKISLFPKSIYLPISKRISLKIHHWFYSSLILILTLIFNFPYFSNPFMLGLLGGVAYHDFITDKHWYRILIRRKN